MNDGTRKRRRESGEIEIIYIGGNEGERETGNDVGDGLIIDAKWLTLDKENSNEERSGYIKNMDNLSVYFFGCFLVCIFIIILDLKSPLPRPKYSIHPLPTGNCWPHTRAWY